MSAELPPLTEELPERLCFEVIPYSPDEVVPPRGVLSLAVLALVVGPAFGWLVQRFSGIGCFGALFGTTFTAMILLGQPLTRFGTSAVRWGQVRRPWLTGAVAFLLLATMAVGHLFGRYQLHRRQLANDLHAAGLKPADVRKELDRASFDNYLADQQGWGLLFLAVPVILVGRHGARALARTAAQPFCPLCQEWKPLLPVGPIKVQGSADELRRLVAGGDLLCLMHYTKASVPDEDGGGWVLLRPGQLLYDPDLPVGVLQVHACSCRAPEVTAEVELLIDSKTDSVWSYPTTVVMVVQDIGRRPIEVVPEDEDEDDEDD